MNKLKTNINGKMPFVLDDIRFLDDVYRSSINAILSGLMRYDGIIYGCKLIIDGNQATVRKGAIWLNGELLPVPEQTFNYDASHHYFFKLNSYFAPEGNKTFGDGTQHDTYEIRIAEVHDGGSSTFISNMIRVNASKIIDNAPGRIARLSTVQNNQNGLLPNAVVGTSSTGALVSCNIKTAFNKNFGATANTVAEGNKIHGLYNGNPVKKVFIDIGAWDMINDTYPHKTIDLINIIEFDIHRIISVNVIIFTDSGRYVGTFHNVKDDMDIRIHKEAGQHGSPDEFNITLGNHKKTFVNQSREALTDTDRNRGIITITYY